MHYPDSVFLLSNSRHLKTLLVFRSYCHTRGTICKSSQPPSRGGMLKMHSLGIKSTSRKPPYVRATQQDDGIVLWHKISNLLHKSMSQTLSSSLFAEWHRTRKLSTIQPDARHNSYRRRKRTKHRWISTKIQVILVCFRKRFEEDIHIHMTISNTWTCFICKWVHWRVKLYALVRYSD